jgi:putative DNA-invertase from lambdoid prophage Rac
MRIEHSTADTMEFTDRGAMSFMALGVRELDRGITLVVTSQNIVARPGGDALSNLVLTILGAVAEFERDLIPDRTRHAMARVKREGSRSGKPVGPPRRHALGTARVRALRADGKSWSALASELGCSVSTVLRAAGQP